MPSPRAELSRFVSRRDTWFKLVWPRAAFRSSTVDLHQGLWWITLRRLPIHPIETFDGIASSLPGMTACKC
jgi:hypothetical protein